MLWMRMEAADVADLEAYRNALDVLKGFPISEDQYDQHFADITPNLVQRAALRIAAAVAAQQEPAQADVDLVTAPGSPTPAYGINIADEWPIASEGNQSLTPLQLQHRVPFPANSTTFDFDTTNGEWVVQTINP
jgi:hypothetical protein